MSEVLTAEHLHLLARLRRAWPERSLVLVGAAALDVHLTLAWRRTADLDLTVIADAAAVAVDLAGLGLVQNPKLEHEWRVPGTKLRLDILAVTGNDLARGEVVFGESRFKMSLAGFDLAFRHTKPLIVEPGVAIPVATVPVIAVLKMSSWLDRPRERERDLEDLGNMLSKYLAVDDMRRWEDARLADVTDIEDQSALALGIDIAAIAKRDHLRLVEAFLAALRQPDSLAMERLSRASSAGHASPDRVTRTRLDALARGLSTGSRRLGRRR